ncbi:MAG TPA: ATP-binding protein [Candidatus Sulfotelmatobacter sp.]|nr:ATP-binding protein [Candidatus Sulfotelmatobacter sp.]
MANFNSLRLLRLSLFVCFSIALFKVVGAEDRSNGGTLSLADLQQLVSKHGRVIQSFRLEGVVCAMSPNRRLIALQDGSATALLEVPTVDVEVHVGDRLAIEGEKCSLTSGNFCIQIGTAPVVDNDGHHPSLLKAGKVYLPAGFQPIRVAWFNGVADAVLKLEWEGPGLRRQKVPNSVLWRSSSSPTNQYELGHGLDYTACNSDGNFLADFENRTPITHGVASNFDVSYRIQPEHTALFFNGYIKAPDEGIYTFYLTSDDGARLEAGEPRVSVIRLPTDAASTPITRSLNQARADSANSSWIELDGEVAFAAAIQGNLVTDLITGGNRVQVAVAGGASLLSTNLLHRHLRVRGICEFALPEKMEARVMVPSLEQLEILDSGREGSKVTSSTNLLLASIAQVKQLKPEQVNQGIPAKIRGVLVGVRPVAFMLQDSTGGISVHYSAVEWTDQPQVGDMLEVEGVTGSGVFAPVIMAHKIRRLGNAPMPEPIRPRWDQLMNGSVDCVYVEIEGILTSFSGLELTLFSADGGLTVDVDGNGMEDLSSPVPGLANKPLAVGDLVRLRGCCMPNTDNQARQIVQGRIQLNCPLIAVEEAAPSDPFSLPTQNIADLLWFDSRASALQRTKLKGQIIHGQSGEYLALNGERGFRILTSQPASFQVGDLIETVGFPKLDGPSPILQEAHIRKTGHAPLPVPVPVSAEGLLDRHHDSTLIQTEATLIGETASLQGRILELQAGPSHFLATQKPVRDTAISLDIGSRLQLVGVYASTSANRVESSTDPFSLLLMDDAGAIRVLARPSWWTAKHAMIIAAVLAGVLGMSLVWITLLRQKIEIRTVQLQKEIQERQRVEQAQAIDQERTRVAQDLHDELGSGLTTMGLLGALVNNPATSPEKKAGYLEQITHSAHSLVTALDEIVWAVNPQHDSIASSASYYAYYAHPFLNAAGIACRLEIADHFDEHPLDPHLRHGVFLAFKEALNNVVRHSGATEVTIKIMTSSDELVIAIHDNGRGMNLGEKQTGQSHDGLVGMRDRLERLGGTFLITSQAGQGTTVEFRIPLPQLRSDRYLDSSGEIPGEKLKDAP